MSEPFYFVENKFVPASRAAVPLTDSLVTRSYACFEYTRTYGGVPFMLERHLDRFMHSLDVMQITLSLSRQEIEATIDELLEKNGFDESGIKLVATGGDVKDVVPNGAGRLLIMMNRYAPFPDEFYRDGVALVTTNHFRSYPELKTTFYMPGVFAQKEAMAQGAYDALYVSPGGYVTECPTCNIFGVKGGKLITPATDILKGVTRELVLKIANEKMACEERAIRKEELYTFDEFFITSTNREVMPVRKIDHHILDVGPITCEIMRAFYDLFSHSAKEHYMHGIEAPPVEHA